MFQSLENKEGQRKLQKNTQKKNKILVGSKQDAAAYGSIHEKDSAYPDQRFVNTGRLRGEYGDHHIWDAPIQRQPVIQMYVRKAKTYDGSEIEWEEGEEKTFWDTVDAGLALARVKLVEGKEESLPVCKYAKAVLDVLSDDQLEIYPLFYKGRLGQSSYGTKAISLAVNDLKGNVHETAKTLIHEAFHIAGGCWKITKKGRHLYDSKLDIVCKAKTHKYLHNKYLKNKVMARVPADAFAQYIMLL